MPRGDRTGPRGRGPQTGHAAGFCAGNESAGFATAGGGAGRGRGRGWGRGGGGGRGRGGWGRGGGRGWGRRWDADQAASELDVLRRESEALEAELHGIRNRIAALEEPQD